MNFAKLLCIVLPVMAYPKTWPMDIDDIVKYMSPLEKMRLLRILKNRRFPVQIYT